MSYDINDLRADLAATIRAVRDKENPLDIERAKVVADLAQTMINSAKVEVDMIRAMGRGRIQPTGFINLEAPDTLDQQEDKPAQAAIEHASESAPKPRPHIRTPMGNSPVGSIR